ncbi:MAG: radical SAM protein [Betaproteobacteria bacterium]|nr:radical SAM protein [Betaproteobacteria bacterium]
MTFPSTVAVADIRTQPLTIFDHSRDNAGLIYVYPVISRRAGGVSIGINLNVNNACNWRCIYCQVPGLSRGAPPPVDLSRLRAELTGFLHDVLKGDFFATRVPEGARRLNDIALSGNGEPTSAKEFEKVVDLIGEVRRHAGVPEAVKTVLITNGSLMQRKGVQSGIKKLSALNGEVWFKLDRATDAGLRRVNNARMGMTRVRANLALVAQLCPTWIQTCMFAINGEGPDAAEQEAYLDFLRGCGAEPIPLQGVLLYGLARQSFQPEAPRLTPLPSAWLEACAQRIRALGIAVKVTP